MKKNIIALAIASAVAAPIAMADAPTIYGKLNVNVGSVTDKGTQANDTASRLGIKGSEDLGNGLKTVYKIEFDVDLAGDGLLTGRNQYLGLAGGFGTVLIGRHDSPMKMVQPADTFNDGAADNNMGTGIGLGINGDNGETRATNVLAYVSPSFSGVKLIAAGSSPTAKDAKNTNVTGGMHLAATYGSAKNGLFLSAAMNTFGGDTYVATDAKDYNETSFSAQYKTGGLTVNGTIRTFNDGKSADATSEGTTSIVNAAYKMGKLTIKGKVMQADFADTRDTGTQTAIGLGYSLGKKTSGYVYTTTQDKKLTATKDITKTYVGLVHKF